MSNTHYYFLPSVRQGLAAAISQSAAKAHRAQIDVVLQATARKKGAQGKDNEDIKQALQLYGPGDILGFHERIVVRHHPERDVGDFEPNYFPSIEFADADYAWRFTAAKADADMASDEEKIGKLIPWITLVVLVAEDLGDDVSAEFKEVRNTEKNLPPHIKVKIPDPSDSSELSPLPNLNHAWRWAHAHVTEESEQINNLEEILQDEPESAICRLLCPRRLQPKVKYAAFVVPTFKLGVLAGLGYHLDPNVGALELAWKGDDTDKQLRYYKKIIVDDKTVRYLKLPYYYRWEFRTGLRGDFEHLVRLLEQRKLSDLGIRDIDCQFPGFGVRGVNRTGVDEPESHYLGMEGALQSVDTQYTPWGRDPATEPAQDAKPQEDLVELLNKPQADQTLPAFVPDVHETSAIDDIHVRLLSAGTAVQIIWHTTVSAVNSYVDYGKTAEYEKGSKSCIDCPNERHQHRVNLAHLIPGKKYYFRIVAEADDGIVVETPTCKFEMPPLPSVVPPIYGRWHRARNRVVARNQEEWLDVLNLDPRHRAAGGLGSEVIRKQQEHLMASAWDQLGAIESANDILRRAQFGRDTSVQLHGRLNHLLTEDFLRVTAPVQKRVLVDDPQSGQKKKMTVTQYLRTQSRIPAAAFDPAFRRIMRPRGPVRKRQGAGRSVNLLTRLASGEVEATEFAAGSGPKPLGTTRLCDITQRLKESLVPTVSLTADPPSVEVGEATTLTWSSTNVTNCTAVGIGWTGPKACSGSDDKVVPFPSGGAGSGPGTVVPGGGGTVEPGSSTGPGIEPIQIVYYTLTCNGPVGSASVKVMVGRSDGIGTPGGGGGVTVPGGGGTIEPGGGGDVRQPGGGGSVLPVVRPGGVVAGPRLSMAPFPLRRRLVRRTTISEELGSVSVTPGTVGPDGGVRFCDGFITCGLIEETVKQTNPFEGIQNAPDPQTMVQAVCNVINNWLDKQPDVSEPEKPIQPEGFIDKVKTMVFPALDPNQTVVERTKKRLRLAGDLAQRFEKGAKGDPLDSIMWAPEYPQPMYEPLRDISHDLLLPGVETIPQNTLGLLQTNRRFLESYMCGCNHEFAGELLWRDYPTDQRGSYFRQFWDVCEYVPRDKKVNELAKKLAIQEQMQEELRDITLLTSWNKNALGNNATRPGEDLVLVVRGDLLKRYPNCLIYAIDAVPCDGADGEPVPGLPEYLKDSNGDPIADSTQILNGIKRVFPVFKATLPPDMTFFGFPFSDEDARGNGDGLGKYFVIEERISEPRFGLDVPVASPSPLCAPCDEPIPEGHQAWPEGLTWSHFGFGIGENNLHFGRYLDDPPEPDLSHFNNDELKNKWNNASSAQRALFTCQKPVRIAVHAAEMLPNVIEAYFEFKGSDPNDRFIIKLVEPDKIEHARNILSGEETSQLSIKGTIVPEKAPYNLGWSYYLDPKSIEFFDVAVEVCDATMRNIEDHINDVGVTFLPDNTWCPWGSQLTQELKNIEE
jgi:hypothetical protein